MIKIRCIKSCDEFTKGKVYKVKETPLFEYSGEIIDDYGYNWYILYTRLNRIEPLPAIFKPIRSSKERLRSSRRGVYKFGKR